MMTTLRGPSPEALPERGEAALETMVGCSQPPGFRLHGDGNRLPSVASPADLGHGRPRGPPQDRGPPAPPSRARLPGPNQEGSGATAPPSAQLT